jgi:hypothetical protein
MGMVKKFGLTYRIDRVGDDYQIVRLLDDITIGSFRDSARLAVVRSPDVDQRLIQGIARTAMRQGKTLWKPARPERRWMPQQLTLLAGLSWYR